MSALCQKAFSLRIKPNVFKNMVWTGGVTEVFGVASWSGSEGSGMVSASALAVSTAAASASANGALSYNNATGSPISCSIDFVPSGNQYLVLPTSGFGVAVSGIGGANWSPQPGLNGIFIGPFSFPFVLPAGITNITISLITQVAGGPGAPPTIPVAAGALTIDVQCSVL